MEGEAVESGEVCVPAGAAAPLGAATPLFEFTPQYLARVVGDAAVRFDRADPFPYVTLDNFLPVDVLHRVVEDFPAPEQHPDWVRVTRDTAIKLSESRESMMGPAVRHLLAQFNSAVFVEFVEQVTGIRHLVPDPTYFGGGMHQIQPGGYVKLHADFNRHPHTKLFRRVNLIIYLNVGWRPEWDGALEFWDGDLTECVTRIEPEFNRCVLFTATERSYHGHPEPLACPAGMTRRSLAVYYYSADPPPGSDPTDRNTRYVVRPGERQFFTVRWSGPIGLARKVVPARVVRAISSRRYRPD
jgi:hypothetical protein